MSLHSPGSARRIRTAILVATAAAVGSCAVAGTAHAADNGTPEAFAADVALTCNNSPLSTAGTATAVAHITGLRPTAAHPGSTVSATDVTVDVAVSSSSVVGGTRPPSPAVIETSIVNLGVSSSGADTDQTRSPAGLPTRSGRSNDRGGDLHYRLPASTIGSWTAGSDDLELRLAPVDLMLTFWVLRPGPQPSQAPGIPAPPELPGQNYATTCKPTDGVGKITSVAVTPVVDRPTVTSVTPPTAGGGRRLTITGTNFDSATKVEFRGALPLDPAEFTVVSPTQIRATVPTLDVLFIQAPPPEVPLDVVVSTATASSANTPADDFTYLTRNTTTPAPLGDPIDKTVRVVCTNTGATFATPMTVDVRITGDAPSRPRLGGPVSVTGLKAALAFDPGAIRLQVVAPLGTADVSITDLGLSTIGGTLESAHGFIPLPLISPSAPLNIPGVNVRADVATRLTAPVTGTFKPLKVNPAAFEDTLLYFDKLAMRIDSSPSTPSGIGGTSLSTCVPATNQAPITSVAVYSDPNPYQPTITSISPSSGPPGTVMTIKGTNLDGATGVGFYSATQPVIQVSDTELRTTAPDLGFGPGHGDTDLFTEVQTDHGSATGGFTPETKFLLTSALPTPVVPVIRAVAPKSITAALGGIISVRGSKFGKVTKVLIGSKNAPFIQLSSSQLIVIAPSQAKGSYGVTVTNAAGTSGVDERTFLAYR